MGKSIIYYTCCNTIDSDNKQGDQDNIHVYNCNTCKKNTIKEFNMVNHKYLKRYMSIKNGHNLSEDIVKKWALRNGIKCKKHDSRRFEELLWKAIDYVIDHEETKDKNKVSKKHFKYHLNVIDLLTI